MKKEILDCVKGEIVRLDQESPKEPGEIPEALKSALKGVANYQ